ncbi:YcgL domain-containing protein [Aggregatibacter actinomycetemcomitans]|nr:YcgL domain-containing protein [Aggregatibacter actinomycetemcomitans]
MLCAIYKSPKEAGMYLYIEKRDQFDDIPEALLKVFGKPIFVMLFNLAGEKPLVNADKAEVLQHIKEKGFYLQTPKKDDWLFSL